MRLDILLIGIVIRNIPVRNPNSVVLYDVYVLVLVPLVAQVNIERFFALGCMVWIVAEFIHNIYQFCLCIYAILYATF